MPNYNRKGAIVRKILDEKTRRSGVVRLDKDSMTFFARVPDDAHAVDRPPMFESKDGREVERWLEKELAKTAKSDLLKWLPVIMVNVAENDRYSYRRKTETSAGFTFSIARFYAALTKDKSQWLQLEWAQADPDSATAIADQERVAASKNFRVGPYDENGAKRPGDRHHGDRVMRSLPFIDGTTSYLAYTPELWSGCLNAVATVNAAEKHFREMIGTKKGLETLVEEGAKRLAAGAPIPAESGEDDD